MIVSTENYAVLLLFISAAERFQLLICEFIVVVYTFNICCIHYTCLYVCVCWLFCICICLSVLFQLLEKAAKNFAFQETVIENSTTVTVLKFLHLIFHRVRVEVLMLNEQWYILFDKNYIYHSFGLKLKKLLT